MLRRRFETDAAAAPTNFEAQNDGHKKLVEVGAVQKWTITTKHDGMHPVNSTNNKAAYLFIKLWPGGGVSGFKPLHGDALPVLGFGDIYGEWSAKGICFYILSRTRGGPCRLLQCEGRWSEDGYCKHVPEGRMTRITEGEGHITTLGTFKMTLDDNLEDIKDATEGEFIKNLKAHILNSPEEQHFYDFKIECQDGVEVNCHKIILVSQTKYFEGLFRQQNTDKVKIDFPSDIIRGCIRFLYTREILIDGENVQDLLIAANYLLITEVSSKCISYILNHMDMTNCIDILNFGDSFGISDIVAVAESRIAHNVQHVLNEKEAQKTLPVHLFRSLIQNNNLVLRNTQFNIILPDKEKKELLMDLATKYCSEQQITESDQETVLNLVKSLDEKKTFKYWVQPHFPFGDPPHSSFRSLLPFECCGDGKKFIKKIQFSTRDEWDSRTLLCGFAITWSDGTESEVGHGNVTATFEIPDGEHINFVFGWSGWFVDNLTLVLSSGKKLGPVGGDGGSFMNSIASLPPENHCFNTFLDGIKVQLPHIWNTDINDIIVGGGCGKSECDINN